MPDDPPGTHHRIDAGVPRLDLATLGTLVDLVPDPTVAADDQGRIRAANGLAEALFGYEPGGLAGVPVADLVPDRVRAVHRAHEEAYRRAPSVRPMGVGLDLHGRRRDGSEFPVDVSLASVTTGGGPIVVATIRDLTEQRRQQAAAAHLAAIVTSSNDAIAATDADGIITSWNPGAERLLGYRAEEMLGRSIFVIVADEYRDDLSSARRRVLAGEHVPPFESQRLRRDGAVIDVEVTLSAIHDTDGHLLGVSGVFRDISDRRRAEAERARAQREHEELVKLSERERIARDLHDVVIQRVFAAGLSLQGVVKQAGPEVAERIDRVIDELDLVTSEIRTTIFGLERRRQERAGLRRQVLDLVTDLGEVLGHEPVVRFTGPLDTVVPDAVVDQVVTVAREALSNVARHAHATATTVDLAAGDELVLVVEDNGVGMGDAVATSGLRNARVRAESLSGRSGTSPAPGGGTRFEWRVPLTGGLHDPQ